MTGDNGTTNVGEDWRTYSRALRRMVATPALRERFEQQETTSAVATELNLSDAMATELKNTLLAMQPAAASDGAPASDGYVDGNSLEAQAKEVGASAENFLDQSLAQLQFGSRLLMGMSLALFMTGIAFLILAGVRSFTHPDSVTLTAVVGGIGIVQIVALFYRNPLQDIGRAISNAQQAKITVLTYTLGVGLVGKGIVSSATEAHQAALSKLTDEALKRLERFTEHPQEPGEE
jgi:hypothetical protein